MDDIYGNLDNYEDENVVNELKNENKDLKNKLEEYALTLNNLQRDFDKLSAEYKKLELNYSSLLKTAKAEIERKTRIITNLNLEKDQLVLSSLQNKGRLPLNNFNKYHEIAKQTVNNQQTEKPNPSEVHSEQKKNDVRICNPSELKDKREPAVVCNQKKDTHKKDDISSHPNTGFEAIEKDLKQKPTDDSRGRDENKNESKENYPHVVSEKVKDKVSKIKHRRKSMPLLSRGDLKFSSDEEEDKSESTREKRFRHESPIRDRKHDRDHHRRYGSKDSPFEPTEVAREYKTSYRDSRDHHHKSQRYNDSDRYKGRGRSRYETRSNKRFSPDRWHNSHREHSNEKHRSDYVRSRVTVSSPPEKHQSFHRSRDNDRHRPQKEEIYAVKHKLDDAFEAPSHKRLRTESPVGGTHKHDTFQAAPMSHLPYSSLQSPDYITADNPSGQHIREIKGTASIKLDDPRLKSNKYVLNTHKDKVVLSTVIGRNVDIKCVDKSLWSELEEIQKMPTPLREKPQISDDYINEIYMHMNKPALDVSLESGEVSCSEDELVLPTSVDNVRRDVHLRNKVSTTHNANKDSETLFTTNTSYKPSQYFNTDSTANKSKSNKMDNKHQDADQPKSNETPTTEAIDNAQRKWRIPLISKSQTNKRLEDNHTDDVYKEEKKDNLSKRHKKNSKEGKQNIEQNTQWSLDLDNPAKVPLSNRHTSNNKTRDQTVSSRHEEKYLEKPMLTGLGTVEGDLELSDETSDCPEFVDETKCKKNETAQHEKSKEPMIVRIAKENLKEHQNLDLIYGQHGVFKHGIEKLCENRTDTSKLHTDVQPEQILATDFNQKLKDAINLKSDKKAKMCDLFGDSSSLITPDDLGIVEPPPTIHIATKFSPLFDNTQDAVDLNIEEMEKVQAQSLKVSNEDINSNNSHKDIKLDKKQKNKKEHNKTSNERKRKTKNVPENMPVIQHSNENTHNTEPGVVKTVIISTGIQNQCFDNPIPDKEQQNQPSSFECKVNQDLPITQSLPNIKALATSTPHKTSLIEPYMSVPETSCSSTNNTLTKDSRNIKTSNDVSNTSQKDLDVPDVRIVVKRRRKTKVMPN